MTCHQTDVIPPNAHPGPCHAAPHTATPRRPCPLPSTAPARANLAPPTLECSLLAPCSIAQPCAPRLRPCCARRSTWPLGSGRRGRRTGQVRCGRCRSTRARLALWFVGAGIPLISAYPSTDDHNFVEQHGGLPVPEPRGAALRQPLARIPVAVDLAEPPPWFHAAPQRLRPTCRSRQPCCGMAH